MQCEQCFVLTKSVSVDIGIIVVAVGLLMNLSAGYSDG